ncbi:hypothetical protein JCM11251_002035 [Rhodosporidiobolus azoricus]
MLTAVRGSHVPFYTPPSPGAHPHSARPPSSSPHLARPPSPARPPAPPPSPKTYRTPFRRLSKSGMPPSPSYSPPRGIRPPSPTVSFSSTRPRRTSFAGPPPPPPQLVVFGDSFSSVFILLRNKVQVYKYKGASARGLSNPSSSLQVGPDIVRRLEVLRPSSCLFMFGSVDLHINYLWQLKAKGPSALRPDEWVQNTASAYTAFLAKQVLPLARQASMKIYVAGATPPIVEDRYLEASTEKYLEKQGAGRLPPLSRACQPHDFATRTAMVLRFNSHIAAFCKRHPHLHFVDISRHIVSSSLPRRVKPQFVDPEDPTNIHLVWESTIRFWCSEISVLRDAAPVQPADINRLERSLTNWRLDKRDRLSHQGLVRPMQA